MEREAHSQTKRLDGVSPVYIPQVIVQPLQANRARPLVRAVSAPVGLTNLDYDLKFMANGPFAKKCCSGDCFPARH